MKSEDALIISKKISPFARVVRKIFNFLCDKVTLGHRVDQVSGYTVRLTHSSLVSTRNGACLDE